MTRYGRRYLPFAARVSAPIPKSTCDSSAGWLSSTSKRSGLADFQCAHEAFDGVVPVRKAVRLDKILIDGDGVAAQLHLRLDPLAMNFAG